MRKDIRGVSKEDLNGRIGHKKKTFKRGFRVFLTYFKRSGKYYSNGEYFSDKTSLLDIWAEVEKMRDVGQLPGLTERPEGDYEFMVLIEAKKHPMAHPRILT